MGKNSNDQNGKNILNIRIADFEFVSDFVLRLVSLAQDDPERSRRVDIRIPDLINGILQVTFLGLFDLLLFQLSAFARSLTS